MLFWVTVTDWGCLSVNFPKSSKEQVIAANNVLLGFGNNTTSALQLLEVSQLAAHAKICILC